jgi:hypothetical protein
MVVSAQTVMHGPWAPEAVAPMLLRTELWTNFFSPDAWELALPDSDRMALSKASTAPRIAYVLYLVAEAVA